MVSGFADVGPPARDDGTGFTDPTPCRIGFRVMAYNNLVDVADGESLLPRDEL